MSLPLNTVLTCGLVVALLLVVRLLRRTRSGIRNLRGPPVPSKIFGHDYLIYHQTETGFLDFQWLREYGPTWRIKGRFGAEQVMTADPKALQHIMHKSGYTYQKRHDMLHLTWLILGQGIFTVEGETHHRHRKVMNPAFSAQQLRTFVPLFQSTARKLIGKWNAEITQNPNGDLLVNRWLARSSMDMIGKAAFDYNFRALDDSNSSLAREYGSVIQDVQLYPTKLTLVFRSLWAYLPDRVLKLTRHTPLRLYRRLRDLNNMFNDIGRPIYRASIEEGVNMREGKRDVMTVLAKANLAENDKLRLDEEEVLAQMHALLVAGHETTASTLTWLLYELAMHPEYQHRMREEVHAVREAMAARGDESFSIEDLDSMQFVLAAIKETLRFHPILYHLYRIVTKDDVIPLSIPVVGKNGETINQVPVSAGDEVLISVCGYNRLKQVWGEDADQWNPERFFNLDMEKQIRVGVYSNLMTFAAGLHGCIGWRFALHQLQVFAAELVEHFEFSQPGDKPQVVRAPASIMIPMVRGREDLGGAMPLHVSPVTR